MVYESPKPLATPQENMSAAEGFLKSLQKWFDECLKIFNPDSINRERLWRSFYILWSSEDFTKFWSDFLMTAGVKQTPTLYQHLTTLLFRENISQAVKTESWSPYNTGPLTENEGNTLHYTAGYIHAVITGKSWNKTIMNWRKNLYSV